MGGKRVLFTPGPVDVLKEILEAQTTGMVSHRSEEYRELHGRLVEDAKRLFGCDEAFIITGSGTAGVEACVASCIRKGETVLVPHNGVFGERLRKICTLHGAKVVSVEMGYGRGIDLERVKEGLDSSGASVLALVHNETSTGVCNRLEEICRYARKKGIFVIVDGVSAIGGHEFNLEGWGAGICATASQKCIGAPPGIALVGAGKEAVERMRECRPSAYYLDLSRYLEYNARNETPFTPAVSLLYALDAALGILFKEGLEKRIERHRKAGEYARRELRRAGFELFAEKGFESNTVTSFKVSSPAEAESIMEGLRKRHGFVIAGGMGEMKGKILRIGHMGNFRQKDLEECVRRIIELRG